MTLYAGEALEVRLGVVAGRPTLTVLAPTEKIVVWKGVTQDDDSVSNELVTSVSFRVADSTGSLVETGDMVWDETDDAWTFLWDSDGLAAGSYKARVLTEGTTGQRSWEFGTIRLRDGSAVTSLDGGIPDPPGTFIDGGTAAATGADTVDGGTP